MIANNGSSSTRRNKNAMMLDIMMLKENRRRRRVVGRQRRMMVLGVLLFVRLLSSVVVLLLCVWSSSVFSFRPSVFAQKPLSFFFIHVGYRKLQMISNAQVFFSRRFERISFFCPKYKWVLFLCRTSSRHQALPLLPSPNSHHGGRRRCSGWGPWLVH